jgi:hypothetical protein
MNKLRRTSCQGHARPPGGEGRLGFADAEVGLGADAVGDDCVLGRAGESASSPSARARAWAVAELEAEHQAEMALMRCVFLGGPGGEASGATCACLCHIAPEGGLHFSERVGRRVCSLAWREIRGLRVFALSDSSDGVHERIASLGLLGPHGSLPRPRALLELETAGGEALFLVESQTPAQLRASLAGLTMCIGRATGGADDRRVGPIS